jgi:hypothetical protein
MRKIRVFTLFFAGKRLAWYLLYIYRRPLAWYTIMTWKLQVSGYFYCFQEGSMKKIAFLVLLTAIVCGLTFAQTAPAISAVSGTLGLHGGRIVLKSGDTSYYTRGLERFIGFIDGLKEGAQATIEGYVSPPSLEGATERLLFPVKLTLDGKEYEVGPTFAETRGRRPPAGPGRTGREGFNREGFNRDGFGGGGFHRRGCW